MTDLCYQPVEVVEGHGNPDVPGLVLICDHASNAVPPSVGSLGLGEDDMARHIAWDIGARDVVLRMAEALGAPAVLSRFSRLVIDPNRGPQDPTMVMRLYDGSIIPGNRSLDAKGVSDRRDAFHRPYHDAISGVLDGLIARGVEPVLVSVHSFTPQLRGKARRPWHAGVLWDRDDRLVSPLLDRLRGDDDLVVGDNEPYHGALPGDTMWTHGTNRSLAHALIEIRNDLIADPSGADAWAERLSRMVPDAVGTLDHAKE